MSEIDMKINKLAEQLLKNEITPEEHVERYNKLIQEESNRLIYIDGWGPREHI